MPVVVDQLSLWTIGFKWAGLDPNRFWIRIPSSARDYFSTLLEAILSQHLDCTTLSSEKYAGDDKLIAMAHIRYWLDDVYAGIGGHYYNRKLLKWATVDRSSFQDWCERRSIPLPEFWFPAGWTEYRWQEDDNPKPSPEIPLTSEELATAPLKPPSLARGEEYPTKLRDVARFRIASQVIAEAIWRQKPEMTIAAMVQNELIQNYGGAKHYGEESVRRWLKEVAPAEVSAKRGRPRKQNPTEHE